MLSFFVRGIFYLSSVVFYEISTKKLFFIVDGGFSDWDEWGPCTAQCGGGDQTRSRRCDNPVPEFGGLDCDGDYTECQRCNMDPCPSTCPA